MHGAVTHRHTMLDPGMAITLRLISNFRNSLHTAATCQRRAGKLPAILDLTHALTSQWHAVMHTKCSVHPKHDLSCGRT